LANQQRDIKEILNSINQQNNGIKDNLKHENRANDSFQKENSLNHIKKPEINKGKINKC